MVPTTALSLRFVLAAIFVCAGAVKLARPAEFETALRKYRVLPGNLVHAGAIGVPLCEIGLGAALAVGLVTREASLALAALLLVFSAIVASNLLRGRSFDCGCGVTLVQRSISWSLVVQDLALAAGAVAVALKAPRLMAVDQFLAGGREVNLGDAVPSFVLAALVLVLAALVRDSVAIWRLVR
jgi:uncharacterized membrane protein YphA (DoxX/SURF4 family)